jgi:hypothetical protein
LQIKFYETYNRWKKNWDEQLSLEPEGGNWKKLKENCNIYEQKMLDILTQLVLIYQAGCLDATMYSWVNELYTCNEGELWKDLTYVGINLGYLKNMTNAANQVS